MIAKIRKFLRVWKLKRDISKLVRKEIMGSIIYKRSMKEVRDIVTKHLLDKRGNFIDGHVDIWHNIDDDNQIHLNFKIPKNILDKII